MSERAFISVGSNIDSEHHIRSALLRLAEVGNIDAVSRVYENPAVGPAGQPDFLNASVLIHTAYALDELVQRLSVIETDLGRVRTDDRYAARTIDLDICLFGDLIRASARPVLPDPDILTRAYLAVTLAELDGDFLHPVTGESLGAIAARLRETARLKERTDVLADCSWH